MASIILVACLSFAGSWVFCAFRGVPVPFIGDEESYLLAGDTFAHGRLTNPTPPMWQHFETLHVLMRPTYMSKYPPGQGIFLALGEVLFGHPIYGVWLSTGLMCAAICWMFYGLLTPRWALVGGLISALQFGIFTYWSQSYWGGAVAALGGALIFGALPRIIKYQRLRDTLFLGLGIGILANTRPLEGILFGIPLGCLLMPWKVRQQWIDKHRLIKRVLLPLIILILTIVMLAYAYNKKVTGNGFMLPYVLYSKQYLSVPLFIWQQPSPPKNYNHQFLADFEHWWLERNYNYKKRWKGFIFDMKLDSVRMMMFFLGYPLAMPSLFVLIRLFFWRKTAGRCVLSLIIILFMMAMLTCPEKPHYLASLTCFAVLLVTIGLKELYWLNFRQKHVGGAAVFFLIIFQLLFNILLTPVQPAVKSVAAAVPSSQIKIAGNFSRDELKDILMKRGGKYLIIVQYPSWHKPYHDWVYNDAGIEQAPMVWARDMGPQENAKLFQSFKDRQVIYIRIIWETFNYPYFTNRQ